MSDYPLPEKAMRLLSIFEEGKKFTEELLRENEKLRYKLADQIDENAKLKEVSSDPRLQEEVRELQTENEELRNRFATVEAENRRFADRYVEVERQNANLINMYVATYRLHSTLDYQQVLQIVNEIVINLIGAERFGVYVLDEQEQKLVMATQEGIEDREDLATCNVGEGQTGEVAKTGALYVAPSLADAEKNEEPIACIPLKVGEKVMGVIAIYQLLVQKDGFQSVDFELFELLGAHAATAIHGAVLYSLSERKRGTLEGFLELLRADRKN